MKSEAVSWGVVLFAARETADVLIRSIDAARSAAVGHTTIDVLVNGNASLATSLAALLAAREAMQSNGPLRVWSIPHGDKANAWNQYVHHIWRDENVAFFVDGYVQIKPDALGLLAKAMLDDTGFLGGSGVPTQGRSAKGLRINLLVNGGFHGNLCCMKGTVLQRMKQRNIRLPVGLYRTDSLMGAMLAYNLDPSTHEWDDGRIYVHPRATWRFDSKPWWHVATLKGHWSRLQRQARGALENAAFSNHLAKCRLPPEQLPLDSQELVMNWRRHCPDAAQQLLRWHPLRKRALRHLVEQLSVDAKDLVPVLHWDSDAQT